MASRCCPALSHLLSVILSEWSEWTPCSPCSPPGSQAEVISGSTLVSIQRRFRACLDLESGQPVSREEEEEEEQSQCPGPLVEERLCPDANICRGSGSGPTRQRGSVWAEGVLYLRPDMQSGPRSLLSGSSCPFNSSIRKSWDFALNVNLYAGNAGSRS